LSKYGRHLAWNVLPLCGKGSEHPCRRCLPGDWPASSRAAAAPADARVQGTLR